MAEIKRLYDKQTIQSIVEQFPVTAILGPRQCGKTTLAQTFDSIAYFDLENPRDLAKFENPQLVLEDLREGLIIIDEIQRKPDLFPLIRYLVDTIKDQKYLILGSASRELIKQSSESLAGRIGYFEMSGFSLADISKNEMSKLWERGGFPNAFLAKDSAQSTRWRENYITTFLEKDIPQLGIQIPANTLRRFWIMLSNYHGNVINYSELARSFGVSDTTVKKYLDILQGTFMIRVLQPWHENISKRLVKNPKIYLRDSGIYHTLLTLENYEDLLNSHKLGASWEGFALEQVVKVLGGKSEEMFFWATHGGAELDLFWRKRGKNFGVEFKYRDAPKSTKSMRAVMQDLRLNHLWVIYPGKDSYPLDKKITVIPLEEIGAHL